MLPTGYPQSCGSSAATRHLVYHVVMPDVNPQVPWNLVVFHALTDA